MSRPGVQGNDVTGDAAGSSSVILSLGPYGPGSCCSGDASGWSGSDGITTTDRTGGAGSCWPRHVHCKAFHRDPDDVLM